MKLLKDWRFLLLIVALVISIIAIEPRTQEGLQITYIEFNSSAWDSGLKKGMQVTKVESVRVDTPQSFYREVEDLPPGQIVTLTADGSSHQVFIRNASFGVEVQPMPPTNIRLGLDLQGGTRALVRPVTDSPSINVTESTKSVLEARMNTYGLRDVKLRTVSDADQNHYIQVEMAGPGSERILNVLRNVGKFEVKIRNETIFTGAEIATVGSVAAQREGGYGVPFTVKRGASETLRDSYSDAVNANQTSCISQADCSQSYICSQDVKLCRPAIEMFLDEELKFSAPANINLHENWMAGVLTQDLVVRLGDPESAKNIEVVMRSGTLPPGVDGVEIVSRDFVDATLGANFVKTSIIAGIAAILAVTLIVLIRYRSFKVSSAIMFTGFSEVLILLGAAAILRQDLDLPSIAGIIAAVGTGVDQQIIITDEIMGKRADLALRQKMKRAYSIIIVAAGTTMATMFPLMTLGIGMVKGFAIMTFLGVFFGLTITRPAYGRMIAYFVQE